MQLDQHVHFLLVDQTLCLEVSAKRLHLHFKCLELRVAVREDDFVNELGLASAFGTAELAPFLTEKLFHLGLALLQL